MSRPRHPADRHDGAYNDPVRYEAYDRALQSLRGRVGLCDSLTPEQIQQLQQCDAPEAVGSPIDSP